jgi:hypothetical protein
VEEKEEDESVGERRSLKSAHVVEVRKGTQTHRLVVTANHGTHRETHTLVRVDEVREVLARRRHRDALMVPQLVQTALDTEVRLPVLAIGWKRERGHLARKTSSEECRNAPAPPAIVPRRYGLISMTFFTVPEAASQRKSASRPV